MAQDQDQYTFPNEDLQKLIQQTVQQILGPKTYDQKQVPNWINQVNQAIMQKLISVQKPFKYLVNCMIMQRKGAHVIAANSLLWDTGLDSTSTVVWPRQKANKAQQISIYAMTTLNSNTFLKNQL